MAKQLTPEEIQALVDQILALLKGHDISIQSIQHIMNTAMNTVQQQIGATGF